MTKKYALILSGGGFKGAFQVGALNYLRANWERVNPGKPMHFDVVAGVSVGALNGAMVAMGLDDDLNTLWQDVATNGVEEIYTSDFIDTRSQSASVQLRPQLFNTVRERFIPSLRLGVDPVIRAAFGWNRFMNKLRDEFKRGFDAFKGVADSAPLKQKLMETIDRDKMTANGCTYYCGFVSLDNGKYHHPTHRQFQNNADLATAILASTNMPIVWPPIEKVTYRDNGATVTCNHVVDGGIRNVSPLGDIIDDINQDSGSQYTFVIINCSAFDLKSVDEFEKKNIAGIALRALNDIAMSEILNNDIKHFIQLNDLVRQAGATALYPYDCETWRRRNDQAPLRKFDFMLISPDAGELGDTLVATKDIIDHRIAHGEAKARAALGRFLENPGFI